MKIEIVSRKPLSEPKYIKTEAIEYKIDDGEINIWEKIVVHDSVHVLVYNRDTDRILLVSQPRIPVIVNHPEITAVYECCAGIIDKYHDLELKEQVVKIAIDEVREELGYAIESSDLIIYPSLFSSVGSSGASVHLLYAEITNDQYVGQQLEPHEYIETYELHADNVFHFLNTNMHTDATTKFLLAQWLLT